MARTVLSRLESHVDGGTGGTVLVAFGVVLSSERHHPNFNSGAEMKFDQAKRELRPEAEDQWNRDADLRAEFNGSFESYLCYVAATVSGRSKVLDGKAVTDV